MWSIEFLRWRREMLQHFMDVNSAGEIHSLLQQQADVMEHDWYSLCIQQPVPFTRPKFSLHATYPDDWVDCYQTENYFTIDPVLKAENFGLGFVTWNDALFANAPELWDAAQDHGLRGGITQRQVLPNRTVGFLSYSRRAASGVFSDEELQLRVHTLADLSLAALYRLSDGCVMPAEMKFSKRELEILRWTAEGKTSAEIAMILSISENTVNFHQKNMQRKCNASNKTQVACYAAATGLI